MKSTRRYRMGERALSAEQTGHRILEAVQALFVERPFEEVTLEATAARAGVTLQTVLRRFGSKSGLIAASAAVGAARVEAQRGQAEEGDVRGAVKVLFDHYEEWGELALKLLGQEQRYPEIAQIARSGRATHAAWVARVFAPQVAAMRGLAKTRRLRQLGAATDVYVWKLLRRDQGLPRKEAERTVREMVEALCATGAS